MIEPIAGRTLSVIIWIEYSRAEVRSWLNCTAIVFVGRMFGFIWFIHVVFTDRVPAVLPASRFRHFDMVNPVNEFITIHDFGVAVDVNGEKFISKYPVFSRGFCNTKFKMKFEGDDSVLGDTIMG